MHVRGRMHNSTPAPTPTTRRRIHACQRSHAHHFRRTVVSGLNDGALVVGFPRGRAKVYQLHQRIVVLE
jgi:hypothetical protein